MSAGRCNIGLTTPRHAEYQIINLILGNITPLIKKGPPKFRWKGVDGLQFVGQAYPTHALLDSSRKVCWPIHTGEILRLKAFV
ncbi:hypothetical protein TNCV_3408151 [Trichonephila clavipes]|nr:hypothetical protein TNCV_3408151 [Trichonephila clavipes]